MRRLDAQGRDVFAHCIIVCLARPRLFGARERIKYVMSLNLSRTAKAKWMSEVGRARTLSLVASSSSSFTGEEQISKNLRPEEKRERERGSSHCCQAIRRERCTQYTFSSLARSTRAALAFRMFDDNSVT